MLKRIKRALFYFLIGLGAGVMIGRRPEESALNINMALLRKGMTKRWGDEKTKRILTALREYYTELPGDEAEVGGVMRYHLEIARQGLALYRALSQELAGSKDLVEIIHQLMWEAFLERPSRVLGFLMSRAKDPFAGFARGMKWVNDRLFPEPYWRRTYVDVENGVGMDYTGCFYYDYFKGKGVPELTRAFCEMDTRQAECFPPQIEFQRKETLPTGYKRCDFRFYKRMR